MIRVLLFITAALTLFSCDIVNIFGSDSDNILLFSAYYTENEPAQLYLFNVRTQALIRVTNEKYGVRFFDWSNEANRIVYETNENQSYSPILKTVHIDGSYPTILRTEDGKKIKGSFANWSPDGKRIVYQVRAKIEGEFAGQLYTYTIKHQKKTRITKNLFNNSLPVWSKAGDKIYYNSDRNSKRNLFSIDVDGTNETQLTDFENASLFRHFSSKNSQFIYSHRDSSIYSSNPWNTYLLDLHTGNSELIDVDNIPSENNFNFRIISTTEDPNTLIVSKTHPWVMSHGATLFFWNYRTGELTKLLNAPRIVNAKAIDID